jgi:predicted RNA-binding protein with PUA-like domain
MAGRWLLKTEPSTYSFADLQRDTRTVWDGVKNPVALKHLRAVQAGDELFIYHTGDEKAVVGIAKALGAAYPDPKKHDANLIVIDLAPVRPLPRPMTLREMRSNKALHGWDLLRLPRLSVMPVSAAQWAEVERLAKTGADG